MAEDRALELLQGRPWLDPEPLDEQAAAFPVAGERLCLAAAAVEGEHQLASQLLTQRLRLDEGLQLGDEPLVLTERELGLDPAAEHLEPELREPPGRGGREGLAAELGERRAAPERERLAVEPRSLGGVLDPAGRLCEQLEAGEVERPG